MKSCLSILLLPPLVFLLISCKEKKSETSASLDTLAIRYSVISVLPHDATAFTQGLIIYNNKILESTGQENSWIAEVNPGSGDHDKKIVLGDQYFGEGITVLNNKIYQLTWKNKEGFIYNAKTYKRIGEFKYNTEGWGITHDGKDLIMSDGSSKLYFLDSAKLSVVRTINITDGGINVKKLNELEYIKGYIYANVWQTEWILKIDPSSGKVVGRIDLSNITNEIHRAYPEADVLNGIAYDDKSRALLITGKLWPKEYLIRLQ